MNIDPDASIDQTLPYLFIDPTQLQEDTLKQLAKEFVLREQANDSARDYDLESAVDRAVARIRLGEFLITFDPENESVGIIDRRDPALKNSPVQPDQH